MAELKACKCSTGKDKVALITSKNLNIISSHVYCFNCGRSTDYFRTEQQAIDAWNKRSK